MKVVLASNNAHKLEEIGRMLADRGMQLLPLRDFPEIPDPPEEQDTFEENALQKARFVYERTGLPCLADDSGLAVDALDGGPGVHSKRFTPDAIADTNNAKLLRVMEGIEGRTARFVCALALVSAKGEATCRGTVEGRIGFEKRGDHGFGYDPLFLPDATPGKTMAELPPEEKDGISHRGNALAKLPPLLEKLL